jgi:hypothetical protein
LLLRLKVPLYVKRKVLQLSIEEASVLVWPTQIISKLQISLKTTKTK